MLRFALITLLGCEDPAPAPERAAREVRRSVATVAVPATGLRATRTPDGSVAIDVFAPRWPGRALDPVLVVGGVVLRRYEHPAPGVLRFLADDVDLPEAGAIAIRWGDDDATRTVLAERLEIVP
jgi:hypothetical protein